MTVDELLERLKKLNIILTGRDLAQIWGMSEENVSRMKSANKFIKAKYLEILEKKFDISLIIHPTLAEALAEAPLTKFDSVSLDFYPDVFASCGFGSYALSENKEKITIPKKCFVKPFKEFKQYSVIVARGDSMETTICNKDRLIVEHYAQGEQIKDNSIYVFCYNDEIYVKRLAKNIDEIIIKSDNPNPIYKTKFVSGEDMNKLIIIGEIVGLMRDLR